MKIPMLNVKTLNWLKLREEWLLPEAEESGEREGWVRVDPRVL